MIKKFPIILLNFTGIYNYESFASNRNITHVDCSDINGVDCYCDEQAREELHRRLSPFPAKALHFIDSGDFHYLTEYWVSRLQEPFSLIVFDHHPDMQEPQWNGVVSCGGWVTDVLEKNPLVRNIIIVGASDELISQIPVHLREKVLFYSQDEIDHHQAWPSKAGRLIHEPVYISIDKDVLRKHDAVTDWSNGDMSLLQLQAVIRIIYAHEEVIGVDITGECSATLDYLSETRNAEINNRANAELMKMILAEEQQTHTNQKRE
ncbi:arginase family protein [Prevotella pectinovora]|uniref:arginase family protein n=1 Tax=Prevotella pectinovora TaxID=1602169 RepID=UPI0005C5904C|nr:arginase family protein [Prevotella pectinovora]